MCCQGELHPDQTLHDLKTVYLFASSASSFLSTRQSSSDVEDVFPTEGRVRQRCRWHDAWKFGNKLQKEFIFRVRFDGGHGVGEQFGGRAGECRYRVGSDTSNADADKMELSILDPIVPFEETTTHLEAELHADFTAVSINQIPQR
mmetsp:Transcript_17153/g.21023  ORF Transcript_17153/g.21023 Transcript_17153/m.21023 type:complete len:146 (+) Transcript_17153:1540-1977(+)